MKKIFYCKICSSQHTSKKNAKKCAKSHLKVECLIDTKTVLKIFDKYFDTNVQKDGSTLVFRTSKEGSFSEFFIAQVVEAYKNSVINCT